MLARERAQLYNSPSSCKETKTRGLRKGRGCYEHSCHSQIAFSSRSDADFFFVAGFPATKIDARLEKIARSVTIYRDTYGVPHVYGPTDASCVFGYVYAQAEDNFWQIEDTFIRALGRASEVYGEHTLNDDLLNRALEIPRLAQAEYDRSSPRVRELCHALVDGFNYFLARNPQVKPRLITQFEPWQSSPSIGSRSINCSSTASPD